MVKSLNTIQHFCKRCCGKADWRGILPELENGACSCCKKITTSIWSCLQSSFWFWFQPLLVLSTTCSCRKTLFVHKPCFINKIMCFLVFMICLHFFLFFMQITLSITFTHETTGVFPFPSNIMHDLTCSQRVFRNSKFLVWDRNHIGVCPNKQIPKIQVIP